MIGRWRQPMPPEVTAAVSRREPFAAREYLLGAWSVPEQVVQVVLRLAVKVVPPNQIPPEFAAVENNQVGKMQRRDLSKRNQWISVFVGCERRQQRLQLPM